MGFRKKLADLVGGNGEGDPGGDLQRVDSYDLSILRRS